MSKSGGLEFNRRSVMTAAAALTGAASLGGLGANRVVAHSSENPSDASELKWEIMKFDSPEEEFKQFIRTAFGLEEKSYVYWAMLVYNYFQPGEAPVPIFAKEAMELGLAKRMRTNVYQLQGNNLSFPLDVDTGEYITEFRNPVSGKMVPVPAAKVTIDDPGQIITPEGNRSIGKIGMKPMRSRIQFRREGENVAMLRIRPNPSRFGMEWPRDFIELGTQRIPAKDFDNPAIKSLYGPSSATFLLPAHQRWIPIDKAPDMAGGYIAVHVHAMKMPSVDNMPGAFKARARELGYGHVLEMDMSRFRDDV